MDLILFKKAKKRGDLSRGTRVDTTWHARPRCNATRTHASACVAQRGRGCVAGPRESM